MVPVQIGQDSIDARHLNHGHRTVGTTATKLLPVDLLFRTGILLRAPGEADPTPNTAPIWIGLPHVTAGADEDTGGLPLIPGATLLLPIKDPADLYVVSTVADQDLAWMGV